MPPADEAYIIKLNSSSFTYSDHQSASTAWERIASAVDNRSIEAELWRHSRSEWNQLWYEGLLDPTTKEIDSNLFTVIEGVCIICKQCIAALTFP